MVYSHDCAIRFPPDDSDRYEGFPSVVDHFLYCFGEFYELLTPDPYTFLSFSFSGCSGKSIIAGPEYYFRVSSILWSNPVGSSPGSAGNTSEGHCKLLDKSQPESDGGIID
jgi:hypothetical protein